jgi:hypothetical protein
MEVSPNIREKRFVLDGCSNGHQCDAEFWREKYFPGKFFKYPMRISEEAADKMVEKC